MIQDIGRWLVLGLLVAGLITILVPDNFFASFADKPLLNMAVVLLFSIPMYLCATGSIPIAAALMLKGLSPGAALVLLMAGPATNTASILVIGKVLGRRTLAAYLGAIVAGAVGFGLAIDYLLPAAWFVPSGAVHAACHGEAGYSWVEVASSALLAALLAYALMKRFIHRKNDTSMTKQIYRVGGMSCNHCKASVEKNLALLPSVTAVEVDLTAGTVAVEGTGGCRRDSEGDRGVGLRVQGARIIASSDRMEKRPAATAAGRLCFGRSVLLCSSRSVRNGGIRVAEIAGHDIFFGCPFHGAESEPAVETHGRIPALHRKRGFRIPCCGEPLQHLAHQPCADALPPAGSRDRQDEFGNAFADISVGPNAAHPDHSDDVPFRLRDQAAVVGECAEIRDVDAQRRMFDDLSRQGRRRVAAIDRVVEKIGQQREFLPANRTYREFHASKIAIFWEGGAESGFTFGYPCGSTPAAGTARASASCSPLHGAAANCRHR